jgi:hypothetical protein
MQLSKWYLGALAALCLLPSVFCRAQGTAFTYQGRLNSGPNPANGLYDLQFGIFDAATNGNQQGGYVTTNAVAVSNGLFTVTLDFGAGIFTGPARWLDISVRTNGAVSFVTLTPRQALTATPYSIQSASAVSATSAQSVLAGNISGTLSPGQLPSGIVTNGATGVNISGTFSGNLSGHVGIGTNNPGANNLQINPTFFPDSGYGLVVDHANFGEEIQINHSNTAGGIGLAVDDAVIPGSSTQMLLVRDNVATSPNTLFDVLGNGNVGIGTASPGRSLQIGSASNPNDALISLGCGNNSASRTWEVGVPYGGTNGSGDFYSFTIRDTNAGDRMVIRWDTGNVGIGTNNPQAALHVVGNIQATGKFIGDGSGLAVSTAQLTSIDNDWGPAYNFFVGPSGNDINLFSGTNVSFGNTAIGVNAFTNNRFGSSNVACGTAALSSDTVGSDNTASGDVALPYNTSGSNNTASGVAALYYNTNGFDNTAIGMNALLSNTAGSGNIAVGYQAGVSNTSSVFSNIDIGNPGLSTDTNIIRIGTSQIRTYLAGVITGNGSGLSTVAHFSDVAINASQLTSIGNTSGANNFYVYPSGSTRGGSDNTAVGDQTLLNTSFLSGGSGDTAGGFQALNSGNGSYNTAIGSQVLSSSLSPSYSETTAVGYHALGSPTAGSDNDNTAVGEGALGNNSGTYNTAIGESSLGINISGSYNIGFGQAAGQFFYIGSDNIAIGNPGNPSDDNIIYIGLGQTQTYIAGVINGNGSGLTNFNASQLASIGNTNSSSANFFVGPSGNATTSGSYNTADGSQAFVSNTSGTVNTAFGVFALNNNTAGSENTATGVGALYSNTSGSFNTADGYDALLNSSGSYNIGLGALAGQNITTGSSNIDIGNPGLASDNNIIRIGSSQTATILAGNLGIGTNNPGSNNLQINPTFFGGNSYGLVVCQTDYGEEIQMDHQRGVPGGVGLTVDDAHIPDPTTAMLMVRTNVANTAQTLFIVQGNGNVGIGTNSPANPLQMGSGAYCSVGGTWTSSSDRNAKQNFAVVSARDVLDKVAAMPITEWQYKAEPDGIRHIGPMAQDFHAAFGLNGSDDKHISTVDEGGVELAAIQALNQKLEEENAEMKARLDKLERLLQQ